MKKPRNYDIEVDNFLNLILQRILKLFSNFWILDLLMVFFTNKILC